MRCPDCARQTTKVRRMPAAGTSDLPRVTVSLIVICCAVFLAEGSLGFGNTPSGAFYRDGALFGPAVDSGDYYRLITSGFLHAGLIHIGFNMWLLWLLGQELDRRFTELYKAHLRDVYSYSYYRVGNHHDAEDLTEQTFLQAYRHFERALNESDGRPLRPWLIRIAHNLAANLYRDRSRKPQTNIDAIAEPDALHTTEDLVEGREELRQILEGVQQLPEDRREALIMRFALGMDNKEIARALGRTDGATKVLIHRAIKQLEQMVAEPQGV